MKQDTFVFKDLSASDEGCLNAMRGAVASALKSRYGISSLSGTQADLVHLQRLLDDRVFSASQTDELESLGVAFGDVLAQHLGLSWVIVTGPYGTYPVLRYAGTAIQVSALQMISKRVEEGRRVDTQQIFLQLVQQVQKIFRSGEYQ
jgi:hypothetical protein